KDPLNLGTPFDSLSPEIYGSIHTNLQLTSQQLRDDLFTCKTSGESQVIAAGECVWIDVAALSQKGDRTYERFGFETSASALSAGAQIDLGEQWYLALAAGASVYETASSTQPALVNGSSNEAGIALKKSFGSTNIGLGIVGGSGEFDAERFSLFPFGDRVTSEQDASFFGSWLRVSHDIDAGGGWYFRPMLDFGSTRVKTQGFEETGAGALNLIVDDSSQAYVTLKPAIEFGGEFKDDNLIIRPSVYLGYTQFLTNPNPATSARLAGAPNVESFEVTSQGDRHIFDAAANVEVSFLNGLSMKLGYWGQFSRNTTVHGADFKLNFSF
ncbi:MAG: autotransporter outer membrane beta-barrel domain-containing protein, partial [Limnothrix sp.]